MQFSEDEKINTFTHTTPSGASHLLHPPVCCYSSTLHSPVLPGNCTASLNTQPKKKSCVKQEEIS